MMRRRFALLSVLVVAVIGLAFFWFARQHEISPSAIEKAASISYTYQDYLGKQSRGHITSTDEMSAVRKALQSINDSNPARVIQAENKTTGVILTFSMLGPDQKEILSYSINGGYLAVGALDRKPVTIYSVDEEEMDQLRDIFRRLAEK